MNLYIGIDVGTSGVKCLLVDKQGRVINSATEKYEVSYPHDGWTEQHPSLWLDGAKKAVKTLLQNVDTSLVKGISFGGQMHGLVVLDKDDKVIRPCILWNDGRCEKQTSYLNEVIGKSKLSDYTGNIAFAGFTAPKILWLKENEPENFAKIAKIMLPKDYLSYSFTGAFATDLSDASGTLLLDVENRRWSKPMLDICGVKENMLPKLYESYECVGLLKEEYKKEFGLTGDVKVIIGGGDNAAAAIGTGAVGGSDCNISLGTSGTIFICSDKFSVDQNNGLHSFCHSSGKWHLMGCILSAASCRKWWLEDILGSPEYERDDSDCKDITTDGLYFLPYMVGERSPHNDVFARAAFIGISPTTTKRQMSKAVMEGVAFALKDCLEIAKSGGLNITSTTICGGGAKSNTWKQIIADVLNVKVNEVVTEQGPSFGAAILAMVGAGEYSTVEEAVKATVKYSGSVLPVKEKVSYYEKKYQTFTKLYPALKNIFKA